MKEKIAEEYTESVSEEFEGGVDMCPGCYFELDGHYEKDECDTGSEDCTKCWNQEYKE
ncbi:hypothetical protein C8E03_108126 [Lachnotalea glycerini]|uniref:Uncharacterized protein n=1 Tax=Lachnotalea glycerini TaxID=1763509 RepID=A0A318EPH2_9FIRM|nr:hypothetical protein [Lachnotalea glycerini]PXV88399.1 hypothetical protein C8E03_108126 [Lachnotalea glycerini]